MDTHEIHKLLDKKNQRQIQKGRKTEQRAFDALTELEEVEEIRFSNPDEDLTTGTDIRLKLRGREEAVRIQIKSSAIYVKKFRNHNEAYKKSGKRIVVINAGKDQTPESIRGQFKNELKRVDSIGRNIDRNRGLGHH